jgi:hypothetical protein
MMAMQTEEDVRMSMGLSSLIATFLVQLTGATYISKPNPDHPPALSLREAIFLSPLIVLSTRIPLYEKWRG